MVARAQDAGGNAGPQMRLALPRCGAGQPLDVEAETLLKLVGKTQLLGIVAGQGDDDRAFVAISDRDPGDGFEFASEIRPLSLAFERQRQQRFFAGFGLDRGGEHSRRCPASAAPGFAAIIDRDGAAGLRQPPSNRQADDAGPDDNGLREMRMMQIWAR